MVKRKAKAVEQLGGEMRTLMDEKMNTGFDSCDTLHRGGMG